MPENREAPRSVERRYVQLLAGAEFRLAGDEEKGWKIEGDVAVFNTWSTVHTDFRERIAPGFFDEVLEQDVRALFNHDANIVLGRNTANTLRLSTDEKSLRMEVDLSNSRLVDDMVRIPMARGDVTGSSFSFTLPAEGGDEWRKGADGILERTLLKAERLFDVGPVVFPFYEMTQATVSARSLAALTEARSRLTPKPSRPMIDEAPPLNAEHLRIIAARHGVDTHRAAS